MVEKNREIMNDPRFEKRIIYKNVGSFNSSSKFKFNMPQVLKGFLSKYQLIYLKNLRVTHAFRFNSMKLLKNKTRVIFKKTRSVRTMIHLKKNKKINVR